MRFNLILITILFIGVSCSKSDSLKSKSQDHSKRLKKVAFNPDEPYLINMLTGDSIERTDEDSIMYGIPYPMDTSEILIETLLPNEYTIPDSLIEKAEAFPHISEFQDFQKIASLGSPKINPIDKRHGQALQLVDAKGKTLKSGVELSLSKVVDDMFFPEVKDALPPRYKGNDIDGFTYLDIEQGLPYSYTIGLAFDSLDNLWTGTSAGGLVKYDGKTFIQFDYNSGMPDEQIYDVLIDKKGHIWLAAIELGLILFDGHNFITFPELPQVEGWCLLESSDGSIWFE